MEVLILEKHLNLILPKGSSINDVTALGGRSYQGFCDDSTKALVIKYVTMGLGQIENSK